MIHMVIMASGFSRRMGKDKLLVDLVGKPVLQWVVEAAQGAGAGAVTVVYRNLETEELARGLGVNTLHNPLASQGQSACIRLAAERLMPASALLFLAGDQPLVQTETLRRLMKAYEDQGPHAAAVAWRDGTGLPALFSPLMRTHLLALEGDCGARRLLDGTSFRVVGVSPCRDEEQWDIDTEAQREHIARWIGEKMG